MNVYEIEAKTRDNYKKGPSKKYRNEGLIPSIIYGQAENKNILINKIEFGKLSHTLTKSTIIKLKLDGKVFDVLVKDYQKNYIRDEYTHIDFYELKAGKTLHSKIALNFVGAPIGVKEGGVLEKHLTELDVECLPKDIVPFIDINVDHLKIGDALHVKDIQLDERYKILSHPDEVLVHISGKMAEEEEVVKVEAEAAVIGEGEEGAVEGAAVEGTEEKKEEKKEKK